MDEKLRIAIDAREIETHPTGAGRYLAEILKRWPRKFFEENEVSLYFKSRVPACDWLECFPVKKVLIKNRFLKKDFFWEQIGLAWRLKKDAVDLFWGPNGACPFFGGKVKKVVNVHDLTYFKDPSWYFFKERFIRQCRFRLAGLSADRLIAISDYTAAHLRSLIPSRPDRIHRIYAGGDHYPISGGDRLKEPHQILFVGSILNRRPIENLIQAVGIVRRDFPQTHLLIIGSNRTYPLKNLESLVQDLGLRSGVELKGYVDDAELSQAYRDSDLFCFPSLCEGFGISVIEAQRHGLPVVTLRNSSLEEIGGNSVCYAQSADPKDLARALTRLFSDTDYREELTRRGFENTQRFSWTRSSQEILSLFLLR